MAAALFTRGSAPGLAALIHNLWCWLPVHNQNLAFTQRPAPICDRPLICTMRMQTNWRDLFLKRQHERKFDQVLTDLSSWPLSSTLGYEGRLSAHPDLHALPAGVRASWATCARS